MTLTTFFNVRLAIAAQQGYAKAVQFNVDPLASVPLPTQAHVCRRSEEERSGRSPLTGKSSTVRADRMQVLRTNRNLSLAMRYSVTGLDDHELTPEQLKKRRKNRAYWLRKQAKRARLEQMALALEKES